MILGMREQWRTVDVRAALRWLGSPVTVCCLGLLALNDQVLKQAWPGLVTGKLSDFAGLVVAPPLLAVVLMLFRVPWSAAVALAATAVGFALTKSTGAGAEVASTVWSWSGFPTYIRSDPTDLVALPALLLAARVWVLTGRSVVSCRRRLHLAVGAILLPFAVVTTAATSCDPDIGVWDVRVVTGDFAGAPSAEETQLVVLTDSLTYAVRPSGEVRRLERVDVDRIPVAYGSAEGCDRANPVMCWRDGSARRPVVESSADGGRSWQPDYEMSEQEAEDLVDDLGERCGDAPRIDVDGLVVLATPDGPVVAASAARAGLLLRLPGEEWSRLDLGDLNSDAEEPETDTPRGPLRVEEALPASRN